MKKIIFLAAFFMFLSSSMSQAEQSALPDGPGKDLVKSKCTACHGLAFILEGGYSAAQWHKVVEDMVKVGLQMTPEERKTITTYLTTKLAKGPPAPTPLPPEKAGTDTKAPAAPEKSPGQALYENNCSFCHRNTGIGIDGAIPPLAGNRAVTKDNRYNIQTVLYGLSGEITVLEDYYNSSMPGFSNLTNKEVAEVINYYTSVWGNKADFQPVKESEVAAERKDSKTPADVRKYRAELCKDKQQ